jgi:hypothetical protein
LHGAHAGLPIGGIALAWVKDNAVSPWGIGYFGYLRDFYSGLRNPSIPNLDPKLVKQFPIMESKQVEFRWEGFNALNSRLYAGPDLDPVSSKMSTSSADGAGNVAVA